VLLAEYAGRIGLVGPGDTRYQPPLIDGG
jgi:hypothetical protein